VRFVQLFLGGQPWDNYNSIGKTLPAICRLSGQTLDPAQPKLNAEKAA